VEPPDDEGPDIAGQIVAKIRGFFLGGNTVVRVGLVVLLVGVVLLMKWAADNSLFPPALRLAGAAALGVGLVIFGFKNRTDRPGFSHTLQGGGLATLYMVVFFGLRVYELIPAVPAFGLLLVIAIAGGALAVLQDAMALIVIAIIGAFMAPIVASTGSGNHVVLFSYYLLLNLSILGVAWHKPWRVLNLVGFVFTFVVGAAWGALSYTPADFATTEPFLVAFFLLYFAIPLLLADRSPGAKRGWVDGSIVFSAPLIFLALQHQIMGDREWGMAFSTLLCAGLYLVAGRHLLKTRRETMGLMTEAFLAIGVGFVTLAIPYALGNQALTGASWAIEGAGLFWLGMRQERKLAMTAGVLLQLVGSLGFAVGAERAFDDATLTWVASPLLAGALTTMGALYVARHAYLHRATYPQASKLLQGLIGLGMLTWAGTLGAHLHHFAPADLRPSAFMAVGAATAIGLELGGRRLSWMPGRAMAALWVVTIPMWVLYWANDIFAHGGLWSWPLLLGAVLLSWRRFPAEAPSWARHLRPAALWALTFFVAYALEQQVGVHAGLSESWSVPLVGATLIAALALSLRGRATGRWPFGEDRRQTLLVGAGGLSIGLLLWFVASTLSLSGRVDPLPFIPVLNPVDLAQLGAVLALVHWTRAMDADQEPNNPWTTKAHLLVPILLFLWFNGLLGRTVHNMTDIPFRPRGLLWGSEPFQVAISVSWTVIGVGATVWASRRKNRGFWVAGAGLLGVVVAKLFLVDLGAMSTIAKIGTFLVVGMLLLAVGYFAPVPPSLPEEEQDT